MQPDVQVHIVDDDPALRRAIGFLVRSFGLREAGYASAEDFLARLEDTPPGCLVLDLNMPGGMNGVELQRELKRRGLEIPTIVVTALQDDPLIKRAREFGAMAVLTKPFDDGVLLSWIERALSICG
jgi:FixJ family two-component response regulator